MKKKYFNATIISTLILIATLSIPINFASAFAYVFAGSANGINVVTHPIGYNGSGDTVTVTVGIDPTSNFSANMAIPVQNVVSIFNGLNSTNGNVSFGNIPAGDIDFESVLLHEMGHSLSLAHCNFATESGQTGANMNYTKSVNGANSTADFTSGPDGVIGPEDDLRGDDLSLNYL